MELIPSFGSTLYTLVAFVVALMVIVFIHEFGHYIVGRWTGIHAEVFSIGFGPVLWSSMDKHGTRWQIAAIPAGGYVRFLGDKDAASRPDEEALNAMSPEKRQHSIHDAPLWARASTVLAGPVFNFILSLVVFSILIAWRGVPSDPLVVAEISPTPYANELRAGDELLAVGGIETPNLDAFGAELDALPTELQLSYTVRRDDRVIEVFAPYPFLPIVNGLTPGSAALDAGIEIGDVVMTANGTVINTFTTLQDIVGNSDGAPILLEVWRAGDIYEAALIPKRMDLPQSDGSFETRWLIGITGGMPFLPATETPGLGETIGYGANQIQFIIKSSISGLYHVVVGTISTCNLRGPVGIAETSGAAASQGLLTFIWFIGVLSTAVGMLNLFPIPVLDGGHLVFHVYEALTGKPPSDGALRWLMAIGLVLIVTLMIFGLTNDLTCP